MIRVNIIQGAEVTYRANNEGNAESVRNSEFPVVSTAEINNEGELASLPELPPGVAIPAPGRVPRQRTPWPDVIDVIFEKDPACRNIFEAIVYPGLWAILYHRVAHTLYNARVPLLPRIISQFARFVTGGIEIHPGAQIGRRFFIDHGAGVVIGETTIIGNNVMLYHQVTLGATGWWRPGPGRKQKRHPTIEDNVTIGVGAAILGPIIIGQGSHIGAMALVLESVPANSVVAAKPTELLVKGGETLEQHQELTQGWSGEMDYQI
jgi:serine O-acetyltransferase